MLSSTTCLAPAVSTQRQPVSSLYQPVSSCINQYQVTLQSDRSHLFKWLFKKNGFLAVSGSDLGLELPEAEQLLDLCQYIIFFALHQFSCSNSHYKLESMEVPKTQIPTSKDSNLIADWVSKKVRQLYAAVSLCLCKCHHPLRAGRLHSVNSVSTSIN